MAIKNFLMGLLLLPLVLVITLFVFSKLHQRAAHNKLIEFINKELEGVVEFEDFNFSYLKGFPHVHLELLNITIHDSNGNISKVGDLDAYLNFEKLWNEEVEIEKLLISDAILVSIIDSLGNKPRFFSSGSNSRSKSSLVLKSHDIEIDNSQIHIGNKVKGNKLNIGVSKGVFNLEITDEAVFISGDADASLDTLISNHNLLFSNQPAKIQAAVFRIDKDTGLKELEQGIILAHTLKLYPHLKMTPHEEGQLVDMKIYGEGNFDTFLELFQFHWGFDLSQVNPEAELSMSYNQQGIVSPFLRPYSEIDFEIIDAEFTGSALPFPVRNFSIIGNLNNGESHSPETTELVIDTLHAEVSDSFVHGRFKLTNLKDPIVDAHLVSNIDLSHLIKENENYSLSGQIDADLFLDGKISELKKLHLGGKQHAIGKINARDLNIFLKNKGYRINLLNGSTILNNHIFEVTTVVGAINESVFNFQGVFDNLHEFFINEEEELIGNISLNFEKIDLNNFNIERTSNNGDGNSSSFELPKMSIDVNVSGKEIVGGFGTLSNFKLDSRINTNDILINNLAFNYQEGKVVANAGIFFDKNQIDSVVADLKGNFEFLKLESDPDSPRNNKDKSAISLPTFVYADMDIQIKEGDIFSVPIQNMALEASINGDELLIPNFSVGAFDGQSHLSGRISFNENKILDVVAKSEMSFEEVDLQDFFKGQNDQNNDSTRLTIADLPSSMDVQLNAFSKKITYMDQSITNFTADVDIVDSMINIERLSTTLPFGQLDLKLKVNNIGSGNTHYNGNLDLDIDTVYVDRLLKSEAFGVPNDSTGKNKSTVIRADRVFSSNANLNVNAKADRIYYQNGSVDNLALMITFNDDIIDLKKLEFYFAGGYVSTFAHIINNGSRQYPAYINSRVDSIDIQSLLGAFNNFNQSVLNQQNSQGNISWDSQLHFNLNESFFPITEKNLWKFNITIHDGEFRKIEPIEKALFFIGHKAKDDLIVSDLEIDAYFFSDKILFKDIFINDNIANMDLFGEIDLTDSIIDVGAEISLTDLFFRSKKKRVVETRNGEVHLDKDMKVFLKMQGPIADHKLGLSSKRKFRRSRESLASIMKEAEKAIKDKE